MASNEPPYKGGEMSSLSRRSCRGSGTKLDQRQNHSSLLNLGAPGKKSKKREDEK